MSRTPVTEPQDGTLTIKDVRRYALATQERLRVLDMAGDTVSLRSIASAITAQDGLPILYRAVKDLAPHRNPTHPVPTGATWIQDGHYVISYDADADPFHRSHIILHEFGHILWRHVTILDDTPEPHPFDPSTRTRNTLFAGLDVDGLCSRWVLRDGNFIAEAEEVQAELTATLMTLRMLDGVPLPTGQTARERELARRVISTLE